mgnify:CR=1 FL=1
MNMNSRGGSQIMNMNSQFARLFTIMNVLDYFWLEEFFPSAADRSAF